MTIAQIDAEIARLHGKGLTDRLIAEVMGREKAYIRYRRWLMGLAAHPDPGLRRGSINRDRIFALFDDRGMNATEIAQELGLGFRTVYDALRKSGRRTAWGTRRAKKRAPVVAGDPPSTDTKAALRQLVEAKPGIGISDAARELGVTRQTVHRHVSTLDLEVRRDLTEQGTQVTHLYVRDNL